MLTDQAIDDACAQAGIGRRTLESRQRDPDTVRRSKIERGMGDQRRTA